MTTSTMPTSTEPVSAQVSTRCLTVDLADGRSISVPTEWFPRLAHGTEAEWANYELTPDGIHWPDLNEDVPVGGLLRGERSGESAKSIARWLDLRRQGRREHIPVLPLPPELAAEPGGRPEPAPPAGRRRRRAG